jgi:hypothetical protein
VIESNPRRWLVAKSLAIRDPPTVAMSMNGFFAKHRVLFLKNDR